jgi:ubiquinone/menaquinone biosynthesis C-methylase UbiE
MRTKKHEHSGSTGKSFENPGEVLVKAGLKKGNAVFLDIGTGSGYLALAAAEIMGSGSKVYAIDSYESSIKTLDLELTKKDIKNIAVMHADAVSQIPLRPDSVDICLMSNVMHGFAANGEMDKVLKNINSVLKEGGKLIVIDFKKQETQSGPPLDITYERKSQVTNSFPAVVFSY